MRSSEVDAFYLFIYITGNRCSRSCELRALYAVNRNENTVSSHVGDFRREFKRKEIKQSLIYYIKIKLHAK